MNLETLKFKGIEVAPSARLHLPISLSPPIRFFGGTLTNSCSVDSFTYVSPGCLLHAVDIGRYCSIGDGVAILSNHPNDRLTSHPFTYENIFSNDLQHDQLNQIPFSNKLTRTLIGHDVWIGAGVKIKSGVSIGNGCIIGAGSVVTKDVSEFSIVGGVPAKLIRMRFSDQLIERIQSVAWWQYNLLNIKLPWDDISVCLDKLEELIRNGTVSPYQPEWIKLA